MKTTTTTLNRNIAFTTIHSEQFDQSVVERHTNIRKKKIAPFTELLRSNVSTIRDEFLDLREEKKVGKLSISTHSPEVQNQE